MIFEIAGLPATATRLTAAGVGHPPGASFAPGNIVAVSWRNLAGPRPRGMVEPERNPPSTPSKRSRGAFGTPMTCRYAADHFAMRLFGRGATGSSTQPGESTS